MIFMTKDEAYVAMLHGKRITHVTFSPEEYLYIPHVDLTHPSVYDRYWEIYDESDYNWGSRRHEPWMSRSGGSWETEWSIYTGVVK
jgi:hypothetical protein